MSKFITLSLILIFSSCAVGPNYKRPDTETPNEWRITVGSGESIAQMAWWDLFKDPDLQNLIRIAIKENKNLLIAAARVEEYRGRYQVSSSALMPQVDANAGITRQKLTQKGIIPYPNAYANDAIVSGRLNWEIDLFGRVRRLTEAAQADLNSIQDAKNAVVMSLVSDVAVAYFQLLDYDSEYQVSVRAINERTDTLSITSQIEKNGVGSAVAVEQAKTELETAKRQAAVLKMQIAQQENAINFLLGRNPGEVKRTASLDTQSYPLEVPAGLPSALLERRPDVREAEQQLIAANARIGAAKAAFFPQISLTAGFGSEANQLSSLFSSGSNIWNLGGNLTQPIFHGGEIKGNYEAAKAVQKQALFRYVQTVQKAFQEVNDALIAHHQYRDIRLASENEVKAANAGLRLANVSFKEGIDTYLSVLIAQRQVFTSELTLAQTKREQLQAVIQLYRALGGGWQVQERPLSD